MALFRSEDMTLCQMFLQSEAAYACVSELGELGLVQFRDLNPDVNAFQRKFVNEVRRCDEMERKLRFLEKEIRRDGIPMLDTGDNPDAPAPREMIDLEAAFEKLENELKEVNSNSEALKRNYLELTELRHILKKTRTFFEEAELHHTQALHDPSLAEETLGLLGEEAGRTGQALRLGFMAGVILRERIPAFERLLWRACRGNVFLRQAEIEIPLEDPVTGDQVNKSVFIIFFQGDQLKSRVKKICEGFRATLYPCPETQADRREMEMGVVTRIEDLNTVLGQTQEHRHRVLVSAARQIKVWFIKVHKIKAIYHTLNMFNLDVTQKCLIAECWCPVADLDRIQQALRRGTEQSGSSVPSILNRMTTKQAPPTYNRTNKFTQAYQNIVDAYGVASYREVNPALFTIITFPFLFAIMYGDAGHGTIMFIFALWMVLYEKQLSVGHRADGGIWDTFFNGRYVILCMGLFSIYTGLIYNDIFSKSINLFQTEFKSNYSTTDLSSSEMLQMDPVKTHNSFSTYPFGIDPIWVVSKNKIVYVNSFKMKLSIILGVFQMYFGILLSLWNLRFFKQKLDIFFCFIPEMVFLFCIVGYLILLVFIKWIKYDAAASATAPSLLLGLINMFMFKTIDDPIYAGQSVIQIILVLLAVISVFVLMLGKPLILRHREKSRPKMSSLHPAAPPANGPHATDDQEVVHHDASGTYKTHEEPEEETPPLSIRSGDIVNSETDITHHDVTSLDAVSTHHTQEEEPFDFSELMMHQMIHTIEFCLGCISHSASYLRLWALSLAHSQLSEVLWNMIMRIPIQFDGYIGCIAIVPIFAAWAALTIGILLIMEGLSAFLHALRLHWIEFQSKFYKGEGYLFLPFSFEIILEQYDQLEDAAAS